MKRYISFVLALLILSTAFTLFICAEAPVLNSFETMKGASVRIGDVAGIRFKTKISKAELDALGGRVSEIGTVIAPAAYIKGEFTMEALAAVNKGSAGYVKVVASLASPYDEDAEYYYFAGSLENIKSKNQMLEYRAVGYMIVDGEPIYAKAPTDSRSVGYVAYHAYIDENSGLGEQDKGKLEVFANAYLADTYGYANVSGDAPSVDEIVFAEDFDGKDGKDALAELGLSEVLRYTSATAYSYGKSITGSVQGGKGVFTFTNGARDNYTSESGYNNTLGAANRDASHAFMKIGGLDNTAIFADGKDKYSIQYTLKIRNATESDAGFGISICEKDTNFARGQYIAYSGVSYAWCMETNNTSNCHDYPGALTDYQNASGRITDELTVRYTFDKSMNEQRMYINDGSGFKLVAKHAVVATVDGKQMNENTSFDLGLYFLNGGTVELDDLLVWSENKYTGGEKHAEADVRIMTLNLAAVDENETDPSAYRYSHTVNLVNTYTPDIICFQEFRGKGCDAIQTALSAKYSEAATPSMEHDTRTPVFYRTDKYTCIASDGAMMSVGTGGTLTKSYTYAVLKDKESGKQFAVIGLHGAVTTAEDRLSNSQQITALAVTLKSTYADIPVFIAGDFNANDTEDAYWHYINSGYGDAETDASVERSVGYRTTHTAGGVALSNKAAIDHVFYDASEARCLIHYVGTASEDELWASDHLVVYADLKFEEQWSKFY